MKKIILASVFLLAIGCSDSNDNKTSPPPPNMRGHWRDQSQGAGSISPTATCVDLNTTVDGINTGLIRIDADGRVYDATKVKSAQQTYRQIGTLNAQAIFAPTAEFQNEFLGGLSMTGPQGISITVNMKMVHTQDQGQDEILTLESEINMSSQGVNQTIPWSTRVYRKTSDSMQAELINKAVVCAGTHP